MSLNFNQAVPFEFQGYILQLEHVDMTMGDPRRPQDGTI